MIKVFIKNIENSQSSAEVHQPHSLKLKKKLLFRRVKFLGSLQSGKKTKEWKVLLISLKPSKNIKH